MSAIDTFDGDSIRSRLLAYLRGQVGGDVEVGPLKRYTVGFSWLTFGFNAKWNEGGARIERDLILRLGPPSGIFAPYRATPEFLTLQSLAGSSVPVPHAYWCCDDSEALGAPFFVCEFVKGDAPVPWTADGGPAFDEAARLNLGDQFLGALAALHNFELARRAGCRHRRRHRSRANGKFADRLLGRAHAAMVDAALSHAGMGADMVSRACAEGAADQRGAR